MVNTGKPSTGCYACRKRRIKCDEGRPECLRCIKKKIPCPGYRDSNALAVKEKESPIVYFATMRRPKDLNALRVFSSSPDAPFVSEYDQISGETTDITLSRELTIDPAVFAVARFYSEYIGPTGTVTPFIDFLPEFYDQPRIDSCFQEAVPALALASASRQLRASGLMIEAQRRYTRALSALAKAIVDPKKARSDEIFTTVFMLSMYETITSEKVTPGVWYSHFPGQRALNRIRGKEQLLSEVGRKMFQIAEDHMLMNTFLSRQMPTENYMQWVIPETEPTDEPLNTPFKLYIETVHQIAVHHAHIAALLRNPPNSPPPILSPLHHALTLESSLSTIIPLLAQGASASKPILRTWVRNHIPTTDPKYTALLTRCSTEDVEFQSELTPKLVFSRYAAIRLHLLQIVHEAASLLPASTPFHSPHISSATAETVDTLRALKGHLEGLCASTVDDFSGMVPAILGNMGEKSKQAGASMRGFIMLWPLRACMMVPGVGAERRRWLVEVLKYIETELGIGQAGALAKLRPREEEVEEVEIQEVKVEPQRREEEYSPRGE